MDIGLIALSLNSAYFFVVEAIKSERVRVRIKVKQPWPFFLSFPCATISRAREISPCVEIRGLVGVQLRGLNRTHGSRRPRKQIGIRKNVFNGLRSGLGDHLGQMRRVRDRIKARIGVRVRIRVRIKARIRDHLGQMLRDIPSGIDAG